MSVDTLTPGVSPLEVVVSQLHRRGERLGPLGLKKSKDPAGSGVGKLQFLRRKTAQFVWLFR